MVIETADALRCVIRTAEQLIQVLQFVFLNPSLHDKLVGVQMIGISTKQELICVPLIIISNCQLDHST